MQTLFKDFPVSQFLYSPDEAPQSQFRDSVTMFMRYMKQKNATELAREQGGTDSENLAVPGRILHLVKPGGNSDVADAAYIGNDLRGSSSRSEGDLCGEGVRLDAGKGTE